MGAIHAGSCLNASLKVAAVPRHAAHLHWLGRGQGRTFLCDISKAVGEPRLWLITLIKQRVIVVCATLLNNSRIILGNRTVESWITPAPSPAEVTLRRVLKGKNRKPAFSLCNLERGHTFTEILILRLETFSGQLFETHLILSEVGTAQLEDKRCSA